MKSLLVGALATVIDFTVTAVFLYTFYSREYSNIFAVPFSSFRPPAISVFIMGTLLGWLTAFVLNYILCIFFVYQNGNIGKTRKGFVKFASLAVIGVVITLTCTLIGVSALELNPWLVKLAVTFIVFIFNFFARKRLVFNISLIRDDENTIRL